MAVGVADAVDVGHQHELAGTEAGRDAGRRVVRVDVADDAVLVAGERRHDRHLAADEERVEQVAAHAGHGGDEAEVGDALADEQAAVDARQTDGIAARVAQPGDELAVDDAAQDRGGDLERRRVGDPQAVLELGLDPESLEPLGDALAAAVDEHDRPRAGDRGDLAQHLLLLRERSCRPSLTTRISLTSCTPSSP